MGAPFFKVKDVVKKHRVHVFSSNYALYGDMSRRVMKTLHNLTPHVEVYSIDEAFLNFNDIKNQNLNDHAKNIRQSVLQNTGIPVSVGIAPTKVLAKVANHIAKKNENGFCVLKTDEDIASALKGFSIEGLWGMGRKLTQRWHALGIRTAWQFRNLPEASVRKIMTVQGHRMVKELKGIPCFAYKDFATPKKQIIATRSFGSHVTRQSELEESIANHISRAAEKLRAQKSVCRSLYVFAQSNRFDQKNYIHSFDVAHFDPGTCATHKLIRAGLRIVQLFYKKGVKYKKSGVCLSEFSSQSQVQQHLFQQGDSARDMKIMETLDGINRKEGKNTLKFAACGTFNNNWPMQSEHRSPCYTTRWTELLKVG